MNKNQLQIVTNHQAKELYKLGFHWDVDYYYPTVGSDWDILHRLDTQEPIDVNQMFEDKIAAPTVALALKWFRDELHEFFFIDVASTKKYMAQIRRSDTILCWGKMDCETYEDAEKALLDELIERCKLPFNTETIEKLNQYIDNNQHLFNKYDDELFIKCILMEFDYKGNVPMLEVNKVKINGKDSFIFKEEKFNNYAENEYQCISLIWLLYNHFKLYDLKISMPVALYLLVAVSYPVHCVILAYVTSYFAKKKGGFKKITFEELVKIYDKNLPNKEFMHGFWDLYKAEPEIDSAQVDSKKPAAAPGVPKNLIANLRQPLPMNAGSGRNNDSKNEN